MITPRVRAVWRKVAELDEVLGSLALLRASVDGDGRAILACTTPAARSLMFGGLSLGIVPSQDEVWDPRGSPSHSYPLTVFHHWEGAWRARLEVTETLALPHVQLLSTGETLVAGTHCRLGPDGLAQKNAVIYDPDGLPRRSFVLGDGVADVQSTSEGSAWVAYTNEGVMGDYGRFGWGRQSPEQWIDPVGYPGLVRFDLLAGRPSMEFAAPKGYLPINDCYALNARAGDTWCSYHPDFPVVCVEASGASRGWATGLKGIQAIALDADCVLLAGRPRVGTDWCWFGRLREGVVDDLTGIDVSTDDQTPVGELVWITGRNSCLHAFSERAWYRIDLCDLPGVSRH